MPYGNRTGPTEMGPRTGRKMGFCSGYDRAGHNKNTWFNEDLKRSNRGNRHRRCFFATDFAGWLRNERTRYPVHQLIDTEINEKDGDVEHLRGAARNLRDTLDRLKERIFNTESKIENKES